MSPNGGTTELAKGVVKSLVVIVIVAAILSTIAGVIVISGQSHSFEPSTERSYHLSNANEIPSGLRAKATTGQAVEFYGDGYVKHEAPNNWSDGNWSVCVTAYAGQDGEINKNATYSLLAVENASVLLEYHAGDWRAIHEVGNETAVVNSTATELTETPLCTTWNNATDELTLFVDGTAVDTASPTSDSPDRQVANDWLGWFDEVRLFSEDIDQTVASTYADDPVNALSQTEHDARLMFDEGRGSNTHVYYQDVTASIVNGTWTSGVTGPELVAGEDYVVSANPLTFRAVSGGYLDGAPVVYVSWDGEPISGIFRTIASALTVLLLAVLAMGAGAVMETMREM